MLGKHGIACDMLHGSDWESVVDDPKKAFLALPALQQHILEQDDGKKPWRQVVVGGTACSSTELRSQGRGHWRESSARAFAPMRKAQPAPPNRNLRKFHRHQRNDFLLRNADFLRPRPAQTTGARAEFTGLTPGQIYVVSLNAVGTAGVSYWSDAGTLMVV